MFVETDESYQLDSNRLRKEKRARLEEMPEDQLREELERIDRENAEWQNRYGVDSPDELAEEYDSPESAENAYDWKHNLYVRRKIKDDLGERGGSD